MQHLDEGTIHAWLDGALSSEDAARAEAHVGSCSVCADAVAEARGLIAASSRILTALDNVPSVRGAGDALETRWKSAGGRRSLGTWLVRERIAAVVALVVAGGALALVMARDTPQASRIDLASEPVRTFELAAADSPAPPVVAEDPPIPRAEVRGVAPPPARMGDVAATRQANSTPLPSLAQQEPMLVRDGVAALSARTDDSLRPVTVAEADRAEARAPSAQATSSVAEKVAAGLGRRRAADASARFAEPGPAAPSIGRASAAAAPEEDTRLVQEEKMMEGGREVRRRIYRVDDLLVTLDERLPSVADERMGFGSANTPRPDSTAGSTTIRWTNANGTEFTLSGAAPQARLERIRKLLGY